MVARAMVQEVTDRLRQAVEELIEDEVGATEMQNTLKKFSEAVAKELFTQEEKFKDKVEELQQEVERLKKQSGGSKGEEAKKEWKRSEPKDVFNGKNLIDWE